MSETEYQRIVDDLKRGKSLRAGDDMDRLAWINTEMFIHAIGQFAILTNDRPDRATRDRADAMCLRCRALGRSQIADALADTAHRLAMQYRNTNHPAEVYDRALAEIDAELQIAEQRPR